MMIRSKPCGVVKAPSEKFFDPRNLPFLSPYQKRIGDRLRADEGDSRNMTRTPLARHATAIAVVLLTFFAQGPIQRLVGPTGPPLIFFVPAVTISAWQGGGGPGLT
jgi:hypothetical protein